ncbi:MAG TPA: hypothetical protein VMW30_05820 [Candidatus Paceibacterota bacterium]|nr:hypothetical protein [Candidatus Paceibacterota bacterium]
MKTSRLFDNWTVIYSPASVLSEIPISTNTLIPEPISLLAVSLFIDAMTA